MTVSDLGQFDAPVVVGQPPITLVSIGSCSAPFTLEASCPPGSWPALGSNWGAVQDVAGGDALALTFSTPVSAVSVASTTNFPPGLTDPSGGAVINHDVMGATSAVASADPAAWNVVLPSLDPLALGGLTFSVVASDGSGSYDFPLTIRTPRYANESTGCGAAYYSTGNSQYLCLSAGQKVPPPQLPPPVSHVSSVRLPSAQHATLVHSTLRLRITVPAGGTLRVTLPRYPHVTGLRHLRAAGTLTIALPLRHPHFSKAHRRITVRLFLHTPTGTLKRTQVVVVNY